jgi:hypothetical protein
MTNAKFLVKLNRGGSFVFVQRVDQTVQTTSNRKVALLMGRLTAEDAVKSLQSSRCTPELIPVQVNV